MPLLLLLIPSTKSPVVTCPSFLFPFCLFLPAVFIWSSPSSIHSFFFTYPFHFLPKRRGPKKEGIRSLKPPPLFLHSRVLTFSPWIPTIAGRRQQQKLA